MVTPIIQKQKTPNHNFGKIKFLEKSRKSKCDKWMTKSTKKYLPVFRIFLLSFMIRAIFIKKYILHQNVKMDDNG